MKNNLAAIIGTGFGLRVIYNTLKYLKIFKVKYVFSRKKKYMNIFSNNIDDLLENKFLNFIFIETPPHTHNHYLNLFKDKKLTILCEKPFVTKVNDLKNIKMNLNKYKSKILVNHQLRHHPHILRFKKELKKIGKIKFFEIIYNSNNISEKKNNWWFNRKLGGGHLLAIGPHLLDLLNFFNGDIKNLEKDLRYIRKYDKKIDVAFNLNGFFANGINFNVRSLCDSKKKNTNLEIVAHGALSILKFENYKRIKILKKQSVRYIKLQKLKPYTNFFSNPWRIAQFYYLKKIFNERTKSNKVNLKQPIKNLELIL